MNRRSFLTRAAAATGYSLWVRLDTPTAAAPAPGHPGFDRLAPPHPARNPLRSDPNLTLVDLSTDVLVAGGGMAGVCAALAAAREGAHVLLVQDQSRLGGNASSEVKMHIVGADHHGGRPGWREGGLIEELRLDDAVHNPHRSFELWDLLLYDKLRSEPQVTLLLDTTVCAATVRRHQIRQVGARCDKSEHFYRITPALCIDCTGDSRLALEAGADFRVGRESKVEFGESLALETADPQTLGSSLLFTARDYGRPIPFHPPAWARKITAQQLRLRPVHSWEYGYWWIEWGGQLNTIRDHERIRFELLAIVLGVWDYIKNSGAHPDSAPWGLDWLGMIPGKRESRRLLGDHILTQNDLLTGAHFPDAVAIGGWPMDDHPPAGFDLAEQAPFVQVKTPEVYHIPLRSLYSRNITNLLMAGRNLSATHAAFTSTRVMATCSAVGQAAGTAAARCVAEQLSPRQLAIDPAQIRALQQTLLRNDQTIRGLKNEDPADLARQAQVRASQEHAPSRAAHILNGWVRDLPGSWANRWAAPLVDGPAWIELSWDSPPTLREVQITFDTGFHRELTLSASADANRRILRGPQPETVRDYELRATGPDGQTHTLVAVTGNHQRLRRHRFDPLSVRALRLHITATHGASLAAVYEIRCYA